MKKFILFIIFCSSFLYAQDPWGIQQLTKDNQITVGGVISFYTAINNDENIGETALTLSGNFTRTKTTKALGTNKQPTGYLRYGIGSITDSTAGYIKAFDPYAENVTYYWSQSVTYISKTGTTFWNAATNKTYLTPTRPPSNFVATGDTGHVDLSWGNASAIETGYAIERDTTVGGGGFVAIDTTAANATSYIDTDVIAGGTYRYRMRTIAAVNSSYTDTEYATVICDLIPTQFAFTDITNAELSTEYQSDSIIVAGITCEILASISGTGTPQVKVGANGPWSLGTSYVSNGDTVWTKTTSSASYLSGSVAVLNIGSVIDTFLVTTKSAPPGSALYLVNKEDGKLLMKGRTYAIKFKEN